MFPHEALPSFEFHHHSSKNSGVKKLFPVLVEEENCGYVDLFKVVAVVSYSRVVDSLHPFRERGVKVYFEDGLEVCLNGVSMEDFAKSMNEYVTPVPKKSE